MKAYACAAIVALSICVAGCGSAQSETVLPAWDPAMGGGDMSGGSAAKAAVEGGPGMVGDADIAAEVGAEFDDPAGVLLP